MVEIRRANIDDAGQIRVRESDCIEIWRTSMSRPNKAVERAITASRDAWTALIDGEIMCIFGVGDVSLINGIGTPWLLGSDLIVKYPFEFLKGHKKYMDKIVQGYDRLENHVDVDNKVSIQYLKWLGFNVEEEARPYGRMGKPFRRFIMEI